MRRARGEAGAGLVEYAFIFLFLMATVLGIMDFSRALYDYHFVSNAARDATRWAAVNGSTCSNDGSCSYTTGAAASDIQAYVAARVPMGIDPNKITTTATWPVQSDSPMICSTAVSGYPGSPYPNYPGCTVAVQVSYQFDFLFPLVQITPITLSSTSKLLIVH